MEDLTGAERLAKRSRAVTLISLAVLTLLAWAWLLQGAGMHAADMPMDGMAMAWDAEPIPDRRRDVGGDDGRDDAAQRRAGDPALRPRVTATAGTRRRPRRSSPAISPSGSVSRLLAAALHGLLEQRGLVSAATHGLCRAAGFRRAC